MQVIQNAFTSDVYTITSIGNGKILVGTENGTISLWQYFRPKTLRHIQNYVGDKKCIRCLASASERNFISVNEDSEIRVWEINSGICIKVLRGGYICTPWSAVVLPNKLLVVSGNCSPAWECFDVWDLESDVCIHGREQFCHRAHGMLIGITAQGYLVASGKCSSDIKIWQIDRLECKLIGEGEKHRMYSIATLPTGEIVTGNHSLDFYKMLSDTKIYKFKTWDNGNVIDIIYPVAGYQVLVVDRSGASANTIKLYNYVSESYEILGNSRVNSNEVSDKHIVLEREGAVVSLSKNKIVVHEFSETIFHFPPKLAEIRKNARVLAQAYRTGTSLFANLPEEINIKIAALSSDNLNDCEKEVSEKIAQNYFSRPSVPLL